MRKPTFWFQNWSDTNQAVHATEDGYRLEISDLESRGILLCSKNKGADQLRGNREADLRLCFRICKMLAFS